jgi:hypothetical protein
MPEIIREHSITYLQFQDFQDIILGLAKKVLVHRICAYIENEDGGFLILVLEITTLCLRILLNDSFRRIVAYKKRSKFRNCLVARCWLPNQIRDKLLD